MSLVRVNKNTNRLVEEIQAKRKKENHALTTKTAILGEAVMALHKKELKK